MNEQIFWSLLKKTQQQSKGSPEEQQELIRNELLMIKPEEVKQYDEFFSRYKNKAYTWDLWGAAFIIFGGCSDDSFSDFRGWLVAQGKDIYMNAIINPESLAELPEIDRELEFEMEGFSYLADEVYEELVSEDESSDLDVGDNDLDLESLVSDFMDENSGQVEPIGTQWQEEELPAKFPRLWKIYDYTK